MHFFISLLPLGGLWFLAAVSPGPNFVLASQLAVRKGRKTALVAVAGIATATLVWGSAAALGVEAVFVWVPIAYSALKLGGGLYLIWLGLRLLFQRGDTIKQSCEPRTAMAYGAAYRRGVITNLANPKTAVFVSSLFVTALPAHPSHLLSLAGAGVMAFVSLSWYAFVAWALSQPRIATAFARFGAMFDRLSGAVMTFFGARLLLELRYVYVL